MRSNMAVVFFVQTITATLRLSCGCRGCSDFLTKRASGPTFNLRCRLRVLEGRGGVLVNQKFGILSVVYHCTFHFIDLIDLLVAT